MAFVKKTWVDKVSQYPNRRTLTDTTSGTTQTVDVARAEGTVTQAGDVFDADTMNNLEERIDAGIPKVISWDSKQNPDYMTYDRTSLFVADIDEWETIHAGDLIVIRIGQFVEEMTTDAERELWAYIGTESAYVKLGTIVVNENLNGVNEIYNHPFYVGQVVILNVRTTITDPTIGTAEFEVVATNSSDDIVNKNVLTLQYGSNGGESATVTSNQIEFAYDDSYYQYNKLAKYIPKVGNLLAVTFLTSVKMADTESDNTVYSIKIGDTGHPLNGWVNTNVSKAKLPNGFRAGHTYIFAYYETPSGPSSSIMMDYWRLVASDEYTLIRGLEVSYAKPRQEYIEFLPSEIDTYKEILLSYDNDYSGDDLTERISTTSEYLDTDLRVDERFEPDPSDPYAIIVHIYVYLKVKFTNAAFEYGEVVVKNDAYTYQGTFVQPEKDTKANNDIHIIVRKNIDGTKQDKLTAGVGITIDDDNIISSTGGGTHIITGGGEWEFDDVSELATFTPNTPGGDGTWEVNAENESARYIVES